MPVLKPFATGQAPQRHYVPVKRRAAGQLPFLNDVVGVVAVVLGFLQGVGGADQLTRVVVGVGDGGVQGGPAFQPSPPPLR